MRPTNVFFIKKNYFFRYGLLIFFKEFELSEFEFSEFELSCNH